MSKTNAIFDLGLTIRQQQVVEFPCIYLSFSKLLYVLITSTHLYWIHRMCISAAALVPLVHTD